MKADQEVTDFSKLRAITIGETEYPEIEIQERLVHAMTAKMSDPEFTDYLLDAIHSL